MTPTLDHDEAIARAAIERKIELQKGMVVTTMAEIDRLCTARLAFHSLFTPERVLQLLAVARIASTWLAEIQRTGPDNGPSLTEQECAEEMVKALAALEDPAK